MVSGHKTSMSLEDPFWQGLHEIAQARGITIAALVRSFSPIRLEGWHLERHLPATIQLKPAPGIRWLMVGLCPPFAHLVTSRYSRAVSGRPFDGTPPWRWGSPPPQGSSLECKLIYLSRVSQLSVPHFNLGAVSAERRLNPSIVRFACCADPLPLFGPDWQNHGLRAALFRALGALEWKAFEQVTTVERGGQSRIS